MIDTNYGEPGRAEVAKLFTSSLCGNLSCIYLRSFFHLALALFRRVPSRKLSRVRPREEY